MMMSMISAKLASLAPVLMEENAWSLDTFMSNVYSKLQIWGGAFLGIVGLVMLIVGGFKLGKALMSQGGDNNWVMIILLILVGGAMMFGGLGLLIKISSLGNGTLADLGISQETIPPLKNVILPFFRK